MRGRWARQSQRQLLGVGIERHKPRAHYCREDSSKHDSSTTASHISGVADTRVQNAVHKIDHEINADVDHRNEENASLHHRVVAKAN